MKRSFITLLLALVGLLAGAEVRAEAFVDIYAGGAFTNDASSNISIPPVFQPAPPPPTSIARDANVSTRFDDSVTYGLRAGYWFGRWFGMAIDAFTFEPNLSGMPFTPDADVRVIPISALLMLRWPLLQDDDYPLGRLHPYIGGGPALMISEFEGFVDLALFNFTGITPPSGTLKSKNVDPAMQLLVGLDFEILPFVGVFGEYRYTLAEPVWSDNIGGLSTDFSVPLRTHHIVGGLSFRF
ncbi:MAG TPA: outer membrane beta-barrel protein [Myxococcota bacterium]